MSHTPGPWVAVEQFDENNESLGILIESSVDEIVRIRDLSLEAYANARLIASAPDLLAALRALMSLDVKGHALADRLQFSDSGRAMLDQCRAAIARATYTPEA